MVTNKKPKKAVPTTDKVPVLRLRPPHPRPSAGVSRDIPYVLRGRDEEFSHLAATLTNSAATTFVVEGPPGTGKTALVTAVGAYAAKCGYTVLDLEASEITAPDEVAQALWNLFAPNGIPGHVHRSFGGHIGVSELGSIGANYANEKQSRAILRLKHYFNCCFDEYATRKKQTKGFLIIFDNTATWRDATEKGHADRKKLKALCNALNDGVRNVPFPITTIFAGTPGTVDTIRQLTSNRLDSECYLHLRGVSSVACQQIIADHLRVQDEAGTTLIPPDAISMEIMREIVELCDGNVWHATAVGQKLQEKFLDHLATPQQPIDYLAYARQARALVYAEITRRLSAIKTIGGKKVKKQAVGTSVDANEETFAYLAAAAIRRENRLDPKPAERLLQAANRHQRNNLTLPTLIQEGLIEYRTQKNQYSHIEPGSPQPKHYCVPIPSFCDHILNEYPDTGGKRTATVEKHLDQMAPVPAWNWREADQTKRFVEPPTRRSKKHVPGNVPRLLDAVPGDELNVSVEVRKATTVQE